MCNISELYIQRGYEKGFKRGYEKGFKIGYEIGVLRRKIILIVRMFEHDIPIDIIADAVEMTIEETQKLIEENKSSFSTNSSDL